MNNSPKVEGIPRGGKHGNQRESQDIVSKPIKKMECDFIKLCRNVCGKLGNGLW